MSLASLFCLHLILRLIFLSLVLAFHIIPKIKHLYQFNENKIKQTSVFFIMLLLSSDSEAMWSFSQDLTAILVKQEPSLMSENCPETAPPLANSSACSPPLTLAPPPQRNHTGEKVRKLLPLLHFIFVISLIFKKDAKLVVCRVGVNAFHLL